MQTFDQSLVQLTKEGLVTGRGCPPRGHEPPRLRSADARGARSLADRGDRRVCRSSERVADPVAAGGRSPAATCARISIGCRRYPNTIASTKYAGMNRGPQAQNCWMCQRSCLSRRPLTGSADRITKPTVIAVRCRRGISHVRPRGVLSKMIAPSRTVGSWNVNRPSTRPMSVFGDVQRNPSQRGHRDAHGSAGIGPGGCRTTQR